MQLGFQLYGGSLGLWRVRRTARRPLAVKPRGMECRRVARRNSWAELIHGVYANEKQHQHVQELKNAIVREWNMLSQNYIQKLYKSIVNRTIKVIENKGGCSHY